jgi:hypothetical protein
MSRNLFGVGGRLGAICLLAAAMFGSAGSVYAKAKHAGQVFAPSGAPLAGAKVTVSTANGLASLYADREGRKKLANPLTSGPDGVYSFYADNGRYQLRIEHPRHGVVDEIDEVYVFDPAEPQTVTASSDLAALTLVERAAPSAGNNNPITFSRQAAKGTAPSGPWRMIVNKGGQPDRPGSFILAYNTDWREGADRLGGGWLPRDTKDPCVALELRPYDHGSCRYLVAPSAPAGAPAEFRPVFESVGPKEGQGADRVYLAGSLLTVGEGLANTRLFRQVKGDVLPFSLAGAIHEGVLDQLSPLAQVNRLGEIRVPDEAPKRFGFLRYPNRQGDRHPLVLAGAIQNGSVGLFATAGKAFVRIAPGSRVEVGDTLVTAKADGLAVVDNRQTDAERIIGWAVERGGQTQRGFVLVILK